MAAHRCGGEAALFAAVSRGAVKRSVNAQGIEMFFFPEMELGREERVVTEESFSRKKQCTEAAYQKANAFMDNLGWEVGGESGVLALEVPPIVDTKTPSSAFYLKHFL